MYLMRRWSVRHSRGLELFYNGFERLIVLFEPVIRRIGYNRLERPAAWFEKKVKGLLFDCQMCGQCVLSDTGMSCPMNCPKQLRNGPCGGVRANGNCEVKPDMKCVWVEAWKGSRKMKGGDRIHEVSFAVDRQLEGRSSWLRIVRIRTEEKRQAREDKERAA